MRHPALGSADDYRMTSSPRRRPHKASLTLLRSRAIVTKADRRAEARLRSAHKEIAETPHFLCARVYPSCSVEVFLSIGSPFHGGFGGTGLPAGGTRVLVPEGGGCSERALRHAHPSAEVDETVTVPLPPLPLGLGQRLSPSPLLDERAETRL